MVEAAVGPMQTAVSMAFQKVKKRLRLEDVLLAPPLSAPPNSHIDLCAQMRPGGRSSSLLVMGTVVAPQAVWAALK